MGYAPTKYADMDLRLKADRHVGDKDDPVVGYFQQAYIDLGGPKVKTGGGKLLPLTVDKAFGPQTQNAVLEFQAACGLNKTGVLDQLTYDQLDWRVYGAINGSWKQAAVKKDIMGDGGPAIKSVNGLAHNGLVTSELVPVNVIGCSRESQRLSDVQEARIGKPLGYEGSVLRLQRGTSHNSTHGEARAGDDMGDQNTNRIIDPDEVLLMKQCWDYYLLRTQGPFKPVAFSYQSRSLSTGATVTTKGFWIGRDRLTSMVLGNLKLPDGTLIFPGFRPKKDVSITWPRATPLQGSGTVHTNPFHLHSDCAFNSTPNGTPFK